MVNKVILIGNLGRDPDLSYTQSGAPVCKASIATSERWTDKEGEKQEKTEWHNLVIWGKQAEIFNEYLRKGSRVYVEGSISYRKWEDRDGNTRYFTDIRVNNFVMLGSRGESTGGASDDNSDRDAGRNPPAEKSTGGRQEEKEYNRPGESSQDNSQSGKKLDDDDLPF